MHSRQFGLAGTPIAVSMSMPDKTILFVEDSEVELLVYKRTLEKAGYCVRVASDGLEAMRMLHHLLPDLVLLDLVLPRFDGVEVLKFMRSDERLKSVPVIIFSTNSIIEAADERLLDGADRRLLKSLSTPALLLKTVREVLSGTPDENHEEGTGKHPLPVFVD